MRTVTYRADESLKKVVIPIGFVGENEHTRVIFDCAHIFREYPSATASISVRPPVGNAYPGIVVHDGDYVYWDVTNADLTHRGLGEIQLTFTQGTKVCKTYTTGTLVEKSIMGTGAVPVPLDDFIARASAAVTAIPDTINAALAAAKASGEFDGEDGFSPVMSVQSILGGHRLTVTDAEGSFYVDIMDGTDGRDGFAPTVTITDIEGGHRITITDKYGVHTFDVMDGSALSSFNYDNLYNKPTIGGVVIGGNKSPSDYGAAELDENGKVKSAQLPSYVDDVVEYASVSAFPATGESGKIYIALDTNLTYRWGGSTYVLISSALALGETSDTAYRGDRGKTAYDHASDSSRLTTAQASGLYKIAVTAEGHVASVTAVTGSDIEQFMPIATVAETQAIIDDYNSQETHAVYETTFDTDDWCFETTEDADDIAAVFMNGGSVVIRLTDDTEGWSYLSDAGDLYLQMVGYYPPYTYTDESDDYTTNALFLFAQPNNLFDDGYSTPSFNITHTGVSEDGKLRIYIEQPEN